MWYVLGSWLVVVAFLLRIHHGLSEQRKEDERRWRHLQEEEPEGI